MRFMKASGRKRKTEDTSFPGCLISTELRTVLLRVVPASFEAVKKYDDYLFKYVSLDRLAPGLPHLAITLF